MNTSRLSKLSSLAGEQLTATYPDGDIVTNAYGAQGWLNSVGTQAGTLMNDVVHPGGGCNQVWPPLALHRPGGR